MQKAAPSLGRILTISGFALSCFGLLLFLWIAFGGPTPFKPQGYRVQVAFPDAATLAEQADVRISGVSVGKVVTKERDPQGNRTVATIELESGYAPLRSDARAILRQKTLLGETYVELTSGSRDAPGVPEGGRLPNARVAETVEFDELLRAFDPDTRRAFQQWQRTTSAATSGHARDFNDSFGSLAGFLEGAADVTNVLAQRQEALRGLVRGTGTTFAALTRNEQALQNLIVRNEEVMSTLSQHRESLAESIRVFPTFLRESRLTLDRLRTFSADTQPLVRDLRPVLDDARPTLRAAADLAPDLRDLFANLRPLIAAGRDGLPALGAVLRGLDPTLAETGPLLQQLNPILQYLELNQITLTNFLDIGEAAINIKLTPSPGGKSLGHALPQLITLGSQSLAADQRTPDNRGNAYFGPEALRNDGLKDPSRFSHPSFDCNHVGEKQPDDTPGCYTQGPVPFRGKNERFPRVEPAGRGGG